jgi:hypothetical protein
VSLSNRDTEAQIHDFHAHYLFIFKDFWLTVSTFSITTINSISLIFTSESSGYTTTAGISTFCGLPRDHLILGSGQTFRIPENKVLNNVIA